ncbi:MAG: hypothetical protein LLG00_15535 [Planctomycetaceae bacterium]|nr:hypothetical protein [Planctomycetaceae bacterium]
MSQQSLTPESWAEQFIGSLQTQRDRVHEFLATHQARLERAEATLQAEIQRLEEMAANPVGPAPAFTGSQQQGGRLDWEAEKRRILAALESDFDPRDPQQQTERLRIEDVLQSTEQALADKDRQIADLKRQVAQLSGGQSHAERQAAVERLLDSDAVIQEERKRLNGLEQQWQEKLRQAEIDLSLQRAKLARDRAELEERIRLAECALAGGPATTASGDRQKRGAPGRWLARLGLTEADRDDGNQDC